MKNITFNWSQYLLKYSTSLLSQLYDQLNDLQFKFEYVKTTALH